MKKVVFVLVMFQASLLMAAVPRDAVVDIQAHITVDSKGRAVRRIKIVRTMNTEWAVDKLSDPKIRFDATRQSLKILTAKTITADNRVIQARKAARNLSTLPKFAKAPDLALHREMVVTMLGIEKGCKTILEYEVTDKKALPFGRVWKFNLPVHQFVRHLTVSVDSPLPVAWLMLNAASGIKPKAEGGTGLHLEFSNLEFASNQTAPTLILYMPDNSVGYMTGLNARTQACPVLREVISGALKKQGTARFMAVLDVVKSALRVLPLEKGVFAEAPRDTCTVLRSGYATHLEATILLKMAMKDAGFQADLEFYGPQNSLPARVNTLWAMTTVGIRVSRVSDRPFFIEMPDFTVSDERVALSGRKFLHLNKNPHVVSGPATGRVKGMTHKVVADIRLDAKFGYRGTLNLILRRDAPALLSLVKDPKAWVKSAVLLVLPKSRVKKYQILNLSLGRIAVSISVKGRLKKDGSGVVVLALPPVSGPFESILSMPDKASRKPGILCNTLDFRLRLPKALKAVIPADTVKDSHKFGQFRYRATFSKRTLRVRASFSMPAPYIDSSRAVLLKHVVRKSIAPALWRVMLVPNR